MNNIPQNLKWRFDVSTFKLLGRELITDRVTAIFELVKNCYDANAKEVDVNFISVNQPSNKSEIIIKDDGDGMSFEDIKNKWMVVGTNSKRTKVTSDPPFKRVLIGEKGIGRFAVEKLGTKLLMRTKKHGEKLWNNLEIDWTIYDKLATNFDNNRYFTDVENRLWFEEGKTDEKGTGLRISNINEPWTEHDIDRVYNQLTKLISPFKSKTDPFAIKIISNDYEEYSNTLVESISVEKLSTISISLNYNLKKGIQEIIKHELGELKKKEETIRNFGPVKFDLYFFDKIAKGRFTKQFKKTPFESFIDGIKIYRDGIITTPFAEYEADRNKQRDILGIDKRRWSGFFEKVSSRDLIGFLEISKINNPNIIDSTNRQDFLDNPAYRDLKEFIISQVYEIEDFLKFKKDDVRKRASAELKESESNLSIFSQQINEIEKKNPSLKEDLKTLKSQARKVSISLKKGIKSQDELEREMIRKENLYLSMLSIQEFASEFAHAIRTVIAKIKGRAEFFASRFPNAKYNEIFKKYANDIAIYVAKLSRATNFMLSFSQANLEPEELDIKSVIEDVFHQHRYHLGERNIKQIVEIKDSVILNFNRRHFEDVFEQLISNSVKAVKHKRKKIIKCSGFAEADKYIIYFSDNGCGINDEDKDKIFEIYYTRTAEEGGSGLGLWIVKNRLKTMNGEIEIIESEFKPDGATFKIILPFKQGK